MPPKSKAGTRYTYNHDAGLGAALAGQPLAAEHAELDMVPGADVTYVGYDDGRDLVLVEWTDAVGTPRITSVDPQFFADHFTKG